MSADLPRVPARYGRRSPKRAPALQLSRLLTGAVPAHPASADYLAALGGGWQMLGNDQAGDCVAVTWANVRRLVTSTLTATPVYPSQDQVWAIYETQNPGFDPSGSASTNGPGSADDNGMDIQTLLEYLAATGGPDGAKAVAFASVDITSADEVKAAIALFGYVWTGINVAANNEDEFGADKPWDWDASSPGVGGHSVITGGYGEQGTGALGGDERFITWATETSFTDAFWANSVEEAWVVIWPEHLGSEEFLAGVNLAALAADYQAITGQALPVPVTPIPSPTPVTKGGNTVFAAIKAKLEAIWEDLSGEARKELEALLADVKAQEEKFEPLVAQAEADVKAAIAAVEPEVQAAVQAILSKLLADIGTLVATAPASE